MSLPLPELLRVVAKHGCTMRLEGETVRMRATASLPEPILAELRARKGEVVEFLSRQGVRHIPDEWRDGARLLAATPAPLDWPASAWERLKSALPAFMAAWAPQAAALGWGTLDLFGCHPQAPYARLDAQGLVLGLHHVEVVAMSERSAAVVLRDARNGRRMSYYRRPDAVLRSMRFRCGTSSLCEELICSVHL
jgi:hypothetical protein